MFQPVRFGARPSFALVLVVCFALPGCQQPMQSNMGTRSGNIGTQSGPGTQMEAASVKNLKQLQMGIAMYTQDWDSVLPNLQTASAAQNCLKVYIKSPLIFVTPDTNQPYLPNAALSGKKLASIPNPNSTVLFYEPEPMSDGTRAVAYVDGHVLRIPEADWTKLKAVQKIP